jgi:hypothetical protein
LRKYATIYTNRGKRRRRRDEDIGEKEIKKRKVKKGGEKSGRRLK